MTHTELCRKTAERFVKSMALYECTMSIYEKPDVLNFDSSGHTQLYEIKMSRSDFLADRNKVSRQKPAFGDERYFVCHGNFIKPDEVPEGWGLYHYYGGKFHKIKDSIKFAYRFNSGCTLSDASEVLRLGRYATALLVNHLICERTNIVFSKRVQEKQEYYRKKRQEKELRNE